MCRTNTREIMLIFRLCLLTLTMCVLCCMLPACRPNFAAFACVTEKLRRPELYGCKLTKGKFARSMAHSSCITLYMSQQNSYSLLSHWTGLWSWWCAALFLLLHLLLTGPDGVPLCSCYCTYWSWWCAALVLLLHLLLTGPDGVPLCSCYCTYCLLKHASV